MFDHLSSCELRLELAEAEQRKPQTIKACIAKRNRIQELTHELVQRGSF
jgi:hypothetical protein